ncbi:ubiquitin-like protein [Brevundimonas subvibrioides]|uniref:ubiquitin-like protein n=1 Tax=Brevundimonas subvibrioides TaxID=74313 RepID=UPI0022B4198A|nr:ubiquitin-like protein [Brevundimonas subvibrioides]
MMRPLKAWALAISISVMTAFVSPAFAMEVFLRMPDRSVIVLQVEPSDTIENVKTKVQDQKGVPGDRQRIIFAGRELEDNRTLADYNVQANSTLILILRR